MGLFSCFSKAKVADEAESPKGVQYSLDGLEFKEGGSVSGSPGKIRRAPGSDSLSCSPRKINIDALFKKQTTSIAHVNAMATSTGAPGTAGNVEMANARALVRALARKPESRQASHPVTR